MTSKSNNIVNIPKFKIGVFCIDKSYFLYHLLAIGFELSRKELIELYFFCTPVNIPLVKKLAISYGTPNIKIVEFRGEPLTFSFYKWSEMIPRPFFRPYILNLNRNHISNMDALIVPLYDYLILKKHFIDKLLIYTTHGMPSRVYAFDNRITKFDLFFLSGLLEHKERNKRGQLTNSNHKVIGFSKYDLLKDVSSTNLFQNKNITILYNPHWERKLSSFPKFGFRILDFFSKNSCYNLIFSPHTKLVNRNFILRHKLNKYRKYDNIIIDLNSERNNDMTYTKYANLYLGDGSSQVLEYLFVESRPCLFLDAHNLKDDKIHRPFTWNLGEIIDEITDFERTIKQTFKSHKLKYKSIQLENRDDLFYMGSISASAIAAESIESLLSQTNR